MFVKLYDDDLRKDVYVATVINDHGLWDGCELIHLPSRIYVRATAERSFALNLIAARSALTEKVGVEWGCDDE